MGALQRRIDRAWLNCKDWITEFDGSASQAYLARIDMGVLPKAMNTLAQESSSFRVSAIAPEEDGGGGARGDETYRSEYVDLESIHEQLARLQRDEIAGLNVNYARHFEAFDIDLHLIINPSGKQKVDLEIVWWSDQVFSDDADNYPEFKALASYFIALQNLFQADKLYIGPETFEEPGPGSTDWVEV